MITSAVFGRYARSLADVAFEARQEPEVSRDLETYSEIFATVPDLLTAFDSPAIPREAKTKLLNELLGRYPVAQLTRNFLNILLEHNRIRYFEEIHRAYVRTANERKGVLTARVTSATELRETELAQLRDNLARGTGKTVALDVETDTALVGGLVLRIGSTVYDGSIRTQLSEMKRRLAERA